MKALRVYVAGPLTSTDVDVVNENISNARKIGEELLKMGHFAYVPHTHFESWSCDMFECYDQIMKQCLDMIETWADVFYYIGSSNGADIEKAKAEELGIPVITDLNEIEGLFEQREEKELLVEVN